MLLSLMGLQSSYIASTVTPFFKLETKPRKSSAVFVDGYLLWKEMSVPPHHEKIERSPLMSKNKKSMLHALAFNPNLPAVERYEPIKHRNKTK
jgi:hypothetical protein